MWKEGIVMGRGLLPQDPAAGAGGAKSRPRRPERGGGAPPYRAIWSQQALRGQKEKRTPDLFRAVQGSFGGHPPHRRGHLRPFGKRGEHHRHLCRTRSQRHLGYRPVREGGKIPGEPEGDVRSLGQSAAGRRAAGDPLRRRGARRHRAAGGPGTWWWPTAAFWRTSL